MCNLLELIRHYAASTPNAVALRHGRASLTYSALDQQARSLETSLRSLELEGDAPIALCYPRSFDQIVGALAAMRAGRAYVPLDPAWPRERIRAILRDSGAGALLAPRESVELAPQAMKVVSLGEYCWPEGHLDGSGEAGSAESLAYVIYTSGSTGTPKGVEITHGNLGHLIAWHLEAFGVTAEDRASHLAGLGFDASVWEVWPYLAAGACVSLVDEATRTSPGLLRDWLVEEEITIAFVPTPLAEPMIAMEWPKETALRFLLTGGDCLHHVPRAGLPFAVVNNYGPTECTVVATSGVVKAGEAGLPAIGRAIRGTRVYVLDEQGREVAPGEVGELCIGGAGVGRGYRGQPEQTACAFVSDPERGRLYRTGDFGCVLADGQIGFRGRVDKQVKIRGQRLELDEIVCVLNRHPGLAFSAVSVRGEGEEKHLVAYVLPEEGATPGMREMQDFLRESLPSYMIPPVFARLDRLPLSANGKVDHHLLPEPSAANALAEAGLSRTASPVEETILGIVRGLLKVDAVELDDEFFLIGGHSLMGTRLVMRVREAFGVRLTLQDLFEAGTVALLAEKVEALLIEELEMMSEDDAASQVME